MSIWYIDFLVALLTFEINPLLVPVVALIIVPFLIDGCTSKETLVMSLIGIGAGLYLFEPVAFANLAKMNATLVTRLSFATSSLSGYKYGDTLAQTLVLTGVTLSGIIRITGTRIPKILSARKYCFGIGGALFIAYFLYVAGIIH